MNGRLRLLSIVSATVVVAALASACSSSTGGGTAGGDGTGDAGSPVTDTSPACAADTTPAAADLSSPVSSFATDVAPIFAKTCAFSSCHGSHGAGNHGLFLAATSTADDLTAMKASLLGASQALAAMPYVTPGNPEHSFVLHKLDGNLCALAAQCAGGSCGASMPSGNDLLPVASRDAIRRWIAQGAK